MKKLASALLPFVLAAGAARGQGPAFDRVVIDAKFPGGYQVETADVNGDGKIDVVAVGGGTCAWYENPSWRKHVVTTGKQTPGIISSATADLDGDGRAEIAIAHDFAMAEPTKGKLVLARSNDATGDSWTIRPIADLGSIHRLRWADLDGDGRRDLVVAPIFGPKSKPPTFEGDVAKIVAYLDPKPDRWVPTAVGERAVLHAIDVFDLDGDGRAEVLAACLDGVVAHAFDPASKTFRARILSAGKPGERPKVGSSEVHVGRMSDGSTFVASLDPWHGEEVAVYRPIATKAGESASTPPRREVLDETLADGHALWVADVDGDGTSEVFAGHRGKDYRVSMYRHDGTAWTRTVLDREIAAQDLRGADLNADGRPDVVAIGGKTGNVVLFQSRPR